MISSQKINLIVSLHEEAKLASKVMLQKEWEFILILQKVIQNKVYLEYKYPSLFKYLTLSLGLSEARAHDYSVVAKNGLKFSKLQIALEQGRISISKARRIAPALKENNQEEWIAKARFNTHRGLEKLVAGENPESSQGESAKYISASQIEVKIVMTEKEYQDFKRAQDLLYQKQKKPVSMKTTIITNARQFLERQDPVLKALRFQEKQLSKTLKNKKIPGTCQNQDIKQYKSARRPIPAQIFHQVQLRDKGRCQEKLPNGQKCLESKWIDFHHIKPIHQGGDNTLQNLLTLCKGHHQLEHWSDFT